MHAYLVIGGTETERQRHITDKLSGWQVADFDQILLGSEDQGIGIADVRAFIKRLSLTPQYSEFSVGIIRSGHRLTADAQQALLKTLEEPPPHVKIIIESAVIGNLLSTVVSRCTVEKLLTTEPLPQERTAAVTSLLIQASSDPDRIPLLTDSVCDTRDDAAIFVRDALTVLHGLLLAGHGVDGSASDTALPVTRVIAFGKQFIEARKQLDVNVTPGLVIDRALRIGV